MMEYLWDELAAVAWLDPSLITKEVSLYMDMDISHTAGYGNTLVWTEEDRPGVGGQGVKVQTDLDNEKFTKLLIQLLSGTAGREERSTGEGGRRGKPNSTPPQAPPPRASRAQ